MPDHIPNEIFRPPPLNLEDNDADLFRRSSRFIVEQAEILPFRNVFIFWGGQTFKKGRVLPESLSTPLFLKKYSRKFFVLSLLKGLLKGNWRPAGRRSVLIVHDEWSANYFHWLTDSLTRLWLAKDLLKDCTLILPESFRQSYHTYTLEKLGVRHIRWTDEKKVFFARRLLLPMHTAPAGNYHPRLLKAAVKWLQQSALPAQSHPAPPPVPDEKIYISRGKASVRRVINEEEVSALLAARGFRILIMEELSFAEQIVLFAKARVLVSIHGAGLTNMMFMPPRSTVLELRKAGGSEVYNCYFNLADVFGHRYFYQGCGPDDGQSVQHGDIAVDLDKLRYNLELMQ